VKNVIRSVQNSLNFNVLARVELLVFPLSCNHFFEKMSVMSVGITMFN